MKKHVSLLAWIACAILVQGKDIAGRAENRRVELVEMPEAK